MLLMLTCSFRRPLDIIDEFGNISKWITGSQRRIMA